MVKIEEMIVINAPIATVFDAERNITLHAATQQHRAERAVAGITSGLIEKGQEVEWEAVHLGIRQRLRVRITHMTKPTYFRDEMISGAFKTFSHEHHFRAIATDKTEKKDVMWIEAPLGFLGKLAEVLFLARYMRKFLQKKNAALKEIVEGKQDKLGHSV